MDSRLTSPKGERFDILSNVPSEIFEHIILNMNPSTVVNLSSSSKEMKERCGDRVWQLLYQRDFGPWITVPAKTWKEAYQLTNIFGKEERVSCGSFHTGVITEEWKLYMWGLNDKGQLGDGTIVDKNIPIFISLDSKVIQISCGSFHTGAITKEGKLCMWGLNNKGQLGDGTTENKLIPTLISLPSKVVSISCGDYHTGAITEDGKLYMGGYNDRGQLGDGTKANKPIPTFIPLSSKVVSISCGGFHTGAITNEGKLFMWGWNESGQLGDGTRASKHKPTHISLPFKEKVIEISCGCQHTGAVTEEGKLYTWGINNNGQLGDGTKENMLIPTHIPLPSKVVHRSRGNYHAGALTEKGELYMWGLNKWGQTGCCPVGSQSNKVGSDQLGDGTRVDKINPILISLQSKVVQISCGALHTGAITEDRQLYMWGMNKYGQLGDGTTMDEFNPTNVMNGI